MDKRGDIGSIVREQSMATMLHIVRQFARADTPRWTINSATITRMVGLLLQQLN